MTPRIVELRATRRLEQKAEVRLFIILSASRELSLAANGRTQSLALLSVSKLPVKRCRTGAVQTVPRDRTPAPSMSRRSRTRRHAVNESVFQELASCGSHVRLTSVFPGDSRCL